MEAGGPILDTPLQGLVIDRMSILHLKTSYTFLSVVLNATCVELFLYFQENIP
jgi:hypothetical protein